MKKIIAQYFFSHPKSEKCSSTSDGFVFHEEHSAQAHANTLKDSSVKNYERDEFASEIKALEKEQADAGAAVEKETKASAKKKDNKDKTGGDAGAGDAGAGEGAGSGDGK